jgi:ABC-type transport system involved in cytochrome c biogenesis ATPase subunit
MNVTELKLRNFTVFESADLKLVPGINVLLGENGTGKTHVLKAIYALLNAERGSSASEPAERIKQRLAAIFLPDDEQIGRLVRTGADGACSLRLKADHGDTHATWNEHGDLRLTVHRWSEEPRATYLPARDVLAMYERFVPLYERAKLSFDKTYYDVCVALQSPSLRGEANAPASELAAPLRSLLGGEVELKGPRFYVNLGDGPREAHLVAEGLRKIAALAYLVENGSIEPGSVLLWDEPETNLNPRLIAKLAEALRGLAERGVQIVLATHDFLLSHKLSLAAEYGVRSGPAVRFFSLHREDAAQPVEVEEAGTLAGIRNNSILDEYAAHYDEERELFQRESEGPGGGGQ